jgi:malate dehydrogenase (oxaloacetate-decarboxylating)(NADP+)
MMDFQKSFAVAGEPIGDLAAAIKAPRLTGIIGVSTVPKLFNQRVIEAISEVNDQPIIFPFTNPMSRSECTAEEAYTWSSGPRNLRKW